MSCGVGHRRGLDPRLLWHRPVATFPIRPLAWEPPYAVGVALKRKKKQKTANYILFLKYKMNSFQRPYLLKGHFLMSYFS